MSEDRISRFGMAFGGAGASLALLVAGIGSSHDLRVKSPICQGSDERHLQDISEPKERAVENNASVAIVA